jgi:hypothetical protein
MTSSKDVDENEASLDRFMEGMKRAPDVPAFRPNASPTEQEAAQTTRAFRDVMDAAADQRRAAAAKLKEARLAKEAIDRAGTAPVSPTGKS